MNVNMLPGFGNSYTSESISGTNGPNAGLDVLDTTKCPQFAAQVEAVTGSPTIQLQTTFDGVNWTNLGSAISAVKGTVAVFSHGSGPYGKVRITVNGSSTAATITLVGFWFASSA